jgi:broad specificity phosphatase PhoE
MRWRRSSRLRSPAPRVTEIVLVRHAQTAWSGRRFCGRSDPPLNRVGCATAERVAADLRTWLPAGTRVIASPRRRAIQTAAVIAAALANAPVEIDERWLETDFGMAEGLTFDQLAEAAPDIAARLVAVAVDVDWPGGEQATALASRIADAWNDLAHRRAGPIVVVTHGGPIRVAVGLATRSPVAAVTVPMPGGTVRLARAQHGDSWSVVPTS